MSAQPPQPTLAWQFESSNVDSITGLAPNLSTTGTYAAPTGGTITTVAGQRIHTFTSVGTTSITFLVPVTAQILVAAGGGGGGANGNNALAGGGGGAGEYYNSASYSIAAGTYTVTVGAGGTAGVAPTGDGGDGGASVFGSLSANGGGGGSGGGDGIVQNNNGRPGGSGGGAGRSGLATTTGGASVKTAGGLGNKGGDNTSGANFSAGGGGGSASAGTAASATGATPVAAGSGTASSISGASVTYASGGTGGARTGTYTPSAGTANQGDGGDGAPAGGTAGSNARNGAVGGSGIVIISYVSALYPAPTYVTGIYGQAISFDNQNSISSGTLASNSYVTYTGGALSAMTSNSFTMAAWVNPLFSIPAPTGNQAWITVRDTQRLYNLSLNTSVSTTNPFFYTSSSPTVRIDSSSSLATGVWFHQCVAFSNVGATSSNTLATYYFNGVSQGSSNVQRANGISVFNSIQLAGDGTSYGAWVSIDDLRLFNTALSAAQVQTIYAAQGMPNQMSLSGSGTISYYGTSLFQQISASATSSAVGAFSLRAVNGVSVKAVQVRNGTTSATQDFYTDIQGNLLTAPVTGQTLQNWLGGATGYVTTWYDQSGKGNHATQATTANQPIIQRATKGPGYSAVFSGSQFLSYGTTSIFAGIPFSICTVVRRSNGNNRNAYAGWGDTGPNIAWNANFLTPADNIQFTNRGQNTNSTIPAWTSAEGPYYITHTLSNNYYANNYVNGAYSAQSNWTLFLSPATTNKAQIGQTTGQGTPNTFYGEIFEFLAFNSSLYDLDGTASINQIYQNQLSYTGT